MEIFSLFGSILLKDNNTKNKLKDIDNTAKQTGNSFDSVFEKMGNTAVKIGGKIGTAIDNLDKKFQLWMEDNKKSASSTEINNKALETYKGKLEALSTELEKSQKALKGVADEFGKDSTEYKEAENHVMDLQLKYKQLEDESKKLQKANESINFKKIADGAISAGSAMTMKFTTPILAAFGLAAKSATSFEHQMADIRKEIAATGMPITQVDSLMKQMSQSSIQWSEDFGQSTDDINQGLLTLVKDGYSGSEAMKIMQTSLYTARGANEDLATTVDELGSSLEAYGMKTNNAAQTTSNMSKMADTFAYVSNHTKASVTSLGEAASVMGSTFTALKIPMAQGAAAIGELQSNGIDASTAANALKAGLVNLVHPSKQMSAAMKEMNLQVFDSKGQLKDLPTIIDSIQKNTANWTDKQKQAAIATIFGKESLSTWNVMIHKGGDYLRELSTSAGNATGEVQKLSNSMKDTPENKFKELKESVHALGVAFGQDILPVLTPFINGLTSMIKSFSNLDDGTKKVILTFAGITAATGPVLSIFGHTYDNVSKLSDFLDKAKLGEKLSGIFTKMPKVSAVGMFSGLTTGLSTAGTAISKFIIGPWLLLGNAFKKIPTLVGNFSFAGIAEKIIGPFKNIPTLLTGAFSKIPGLFTSLKTVFMGFGTTIISLGPKVLTGIKSMFSIQGIMTGARTALSLFTNPWAILILAIVAGVGAIIANWSKISAFAKKIFGGDTTQVFTQFKTFFIQVWEDIKTNLTAAWNYISPTITGAVKEIQSFWNAAWPEIKQVFVEVWDVMKVVIAPVLAVMYTAISTGIGVIKGIWGPAWSAIKDTLKTVWDAMSGVIKVAWDVISGVIKVGLDLATGHWSKAWGDFKSIFSNVWRDLKSSVSNIAKDALQWGKDIIQGIINGIKGGISGLEDAVGNITNTIWKYLHHSVPEEGLLADDDTWMPDFMQNMADGITDNTEIVTDALGKLTTKIKAKAQIKAPAITTSTADNSTQNLDASSNNNQTVNSVNTLSSKMSGAVTTLADKFTQDGQQLNTNLGKALTDTQDKVTKPVDTLNTSITTKMAALVQSFINHGQNSDTNLGNGITTNSDATLTPLNTLITTITTGIKTFVQSCIGHGQDTDTNIGTGITNSSGEVVNAANNVTTTVGNNLDTFAKGSVKYGQSTDNSIASGVTNTVSAVTSAVSNLTNTIGNALKTFASSCTSIGNEIVNAIGSGVQASESNLVSIVQTLTQKVIDAFKNGFGIHSPSKIMFAIGDFLMQGLINGMTATDLNKFIMNWIGSITGSVGGNVSGWLSAALAITGTPMDWLPGLLKLTSYESGNPGTLGSGSATLVNSEAVGNEYATGLLQMLPTTFAENMLSGFGDIENPIDNAISAIRYIKNRYGSVYNTPLFTSGGTYNGYASGTDNATEGAHPVAENGFEIVLSKALKWFSGGETVLNNADSMKLLDNIKNAVETVKSLGSMNFSSMPAIKTQETKITENKSANTEKQPVVLKLVLQNGKELAEYLIDDINKLQGEIQLSKNRVALGRR